MQFHPVAQGELLFIPNKKNCDFANATNWLKAKNLHSYRTKVWRTRCRKWRIWLQPHLEAEIPPSAHNFLKAWHIIRKFCFYFRSKKLLPPFIVSCYTYCLSIGRRIAASTALATSFTCGSLEGHWWSFFIVTCKTKFCVRTLKAEAINWQEIWCCCCDLKLREPHLLFRQHERLHICCSGS